MKIRPSSLKRYGALLVVVILAAGVFLFEEKHRAETVKNHLPAPELKDPAFLMPPVETPSGFSDYADLWGDPRPKNSDAGSFHASFAPQNEIEIVPADFEKIQFKPGDKTEPALSVKDKEAVLAILSASGFKLTVNLKPDFTTPETLLPTRIEPGIGGSFSF